MADNAVKSKTTKKVRGEATARKLVEAATIEFNTAGFHGTDTNRIARRAGFAPQTFYRWYVDKMEVFLAVYRAWEDDERHTIEKLIEQDSSPSTVAKSLIAHHRKFKNFRRSLRLLSLEDEQARKARAESRRRQMTRLRASLPAAENLSDADLAAWLLQFERLCDAAAENEFTDMKIRQADAMAQVALHAAVLWPGQAK
ncbi:TetR/AcrR family transcriptional regulator [Pyruvatibacter sp.]|uniref:TetR/AcrR family transcriptional regulator n=1 Tax=Pyruvatibacter sp. TaxID=1981328 RepID=UPI003262FC1B